MTAVPPSTDPAQRHRPHDRDTPRVVAHKPSSRGLTPLDIGQALGLGENAVRDLLGIQTPLRTD